MSRLLVLRHAKSDWPPGVPDHDRPLAERGVRDAAAAGRWIADVVGVPERVLVSSARRTRETWALVAVGLGFTDIPLDGSLAGPAYVEPRLYDASPGTLLSVLRELPDEVATAMIVAHNPGSAQLALGLTGTAQPDALARLRTKYPTTGLAVLDVPVAWHALDPGCAHLADFVVPRG